jgi:hypothetical protein
MFIKFQMAPSAHDFDKFSLEQNMFFIWPGGGIPFLVCGISQKKSVDLHFLGMTSCLLYFMQSPKLTVSFFSVSSHFTTAIFVFFVNADNMSKMNPVFSIVFHTNTITYIDA